MIDTTYYYKFIIEKVIFMIILYQNENGEYHHEVLWLRHIKRARADILIETEQG